MSSSISEFPQVLIAPGLGSSGPLHWQTSWEKEQPHFKRIEQSDWDFPQCADWVTRIEEEIKHAGENVIIVAHSLACIALAFWARETSLKIKGALLVAPADTERADFPKEPRGFSPIPLQGLNFPSILVASVNDPYITLERCEHLAAKWGSRFENIGAAGHINASSGLGSWPEGKVFVEELMDG